MALKAVCECGIGITDEGVTFLLQTRAVSLCYVVYGLAGYKPMQPAMK